MPPPRPPRRRPWSPPTSPLPPVDLAPRRRASTPDLPPRVPILIPDWPPRPPLAPPPRRPTPAPRASWPDHVNGLLPLRHAVSDLFPEHRCPVPYSPCEPPSVLLSPPLPRCGHHIPVRSPRPGTSSHAQRTRPGTAALPGALTASCRSTHAPVAQAPASAAAVRRRPLLPRPDLAPSPRRCRARRCPSGCRGARSWAAQPQALCH